MRQVIIGELFRSWYQYMSRVRRRRVAHDEPDNHGDGRIVLTEISSLKGNN